MDVEIPFSPNSIFDPRAYFVLDMDGIIRAGVTKDSLLFTAVH